MGAKLEGLSPGDNNLLLFQSGVKGKFFYPKS
jgi:hypothetical protein